MITAEPDIVRTTLQPEDEFILLACDGVWDVMTCQVRFFTLFQRKGGGG